MTTHHQDQTRLTFELPVIEHKKLKAITSCWRFLKGLNF